MNLDRYQQGEGLQKRTVFWSEEYLDRLGYPMTVPKHLARFRIAFGEHIPERQVENMCPTLAGYGNFIEVSPRTFQLEAQREGGRKGVVKILKDWESRGVVR